MKLRNCHIDAGVELSPQTALENIVNALVDELEHAPAATGDLAITERVLADEARAIFERVWNERRPKRSTAAHGNARRIVP
jgi:hypothetical protein